MRVVGGSIRLTRRSAGSSGKKRRGREGEAKDDVEERGEKVSRPSKTSKKRTAPPTPFMERLYVVCKRIPPGKVATYGLLAKVVKSHPRAIGQALRHNPYAPIVPCHRVVAGTLEIGGFGGQWGEQCENAVKKRKMLVDEGIAFDGFKVDGHQFVVDEEVLCEKE